METITSPVVDFFLVVKSVNLQSLDTTYNYIDLILNTMVFWKLCDVIPKGMLHLRIELV